MKTVALAVLLIVTGIARAEQAWVTDDLVLTVYAEKNQQGARVATLHSGDRLEVLAHDGEYAQVRLADGDAGWVKRSFLVAHESAASRLKAAEDELARLRAAAPGSNVAKPAPGPAADSGLRAEFDTLKRELEARQQLIETLKAQGQIPPPAVRTGWVGPAIVSGLLCLAAGFGWGYMTLARRIRAKFGGVKVF